MRKIKNFIQRGLHGFSDDDVWDFDIYLAEIISGAMKKMRKDGISYRLPDNYKDVFSTSMTKDQEKLAIEAWHTVLLDIEEGFRQYADGREDSAEFLDGLHLFTQYYKDLWD